MSLRRASAVAAAAVLLGSLATGQAPAAVAAPAAANAACQIPVGSVDAGGDLAHSTITATTPPTARHSTGQHMFTPGVAKLSSTWTYTVLNPVGFYDAAYVVLNSSLYYARYGEDTDGTTINSLHKIGGGWDKFTSIEESFYWGKTFRGAFYGMRNDGVLFRWTDGFKKVSSYPGFSAVKTMTLISETATYDTFLANTKGGALYTIRIPASTPMKPVVKQVRSRTWQGFEHLVADKCGSQSTLLTGIDKDTGSAYLYAVSHANGTSTVIKGLGKVPGTYKDPVYYLNTAEGNAPLFGE
ncbi:hypothetical protein [Kribbella sp. HUAS MG21]|jgi:hypothetical protein|uniref:Tachylectin 2 domain-containing protein n=1 Tax=Kribbella sp. HUAS MG21 TaxID=3160966 RepID=A0AAU7TGX6_9ACTN